MSLSVLGGLVSEIIFWASLDSKTPFITFFRALVWKKCDAVNDMEGDVHAIVEGSGRVAVDTLVGFAIFEADPGDFDLGHRVSWPADISTGSHAVTNHSTGRTCRVYFLNSRVPATLLKANL